MHKKFKALILEEARTYISNLNDAEQGVAKADIESMEAGDFESVKTKQLKGKVRELIFGAHRITYFQLRSSLYFIRGFPKKSAKTPKREIEYAEKIYQMVNDARK